MAIALRYLHIYFIRREREGDKNSMCILPCNPKKKRTNIRRIPNERKTKAIQFITLNVRK